MKQKIRIRPIEYLIDQGTFPAKKVSGFAVYLPDLPVRICVRYHPVRGWEADHYDSGLGFLTRSAEEGIAPLVRDVAKLLRQSISDGRYNQAMQRRGLTHLCV